MTTSARFAAALRGGDRHVGGWQGARVGHAEEDEETDFFCCIVFVDIWIWRQRARGWVSSEADMFKVYCILIQV